MFESQTRARTDQQRTRASTAFDRCPKELKSAFVLNVSHELRTPLTVIKGTIDNLVRGLHGEFSHEQKKQLDLIKDNAEQLTRAVDDFLLFDCQDICRTM